MKLLFLSLWYFKLPYDPNQLFVSYAPTENPEYSDDRDNGRFSEPDGNQTDAVVLTHD